MLRHRRIAQQRLLITALLCLVAAVSVAAWSLKGPTGQQKRERVIEKAFTRDAPVVEITEVKVSKKVVDLGKKFDGDDNWPSTLLLKVKNVSNKPIVYLRVNLNFPETRATGSMMSYPLVFGQMPGSKFPQREDPIFMMTEDTIEIPLEGYYEKVKSFVEQRKPIKELSKIELEIGFVIFADRTAWVAGDYLRQDPNDPDRYINIGPRPPQ